MEKRWVNKTIASEAQIEQLSGAINISPILSSILLQRGVSTFEEAKAFFRPSLTDLHDPFLMKDMDKAIARLCKAMSSHEKILIYGDYDVDGTTSVAMVYHFLSNRYPHIDYYIPDRYKEGYGISFQAIEWAHENKFSLIISLDCGIKAVELIRHAANYGIEFIVCDHHTVGEELPPAHAVLDPKRKDCEYPYKELSGCGVGFKLLQGYCQNQGIDIAELYPYLDLVTISIASDIVPITGENRVLAYFGLKTIQESPRPGVKALHDLAGYKKELDISGIVFGIGPRINAAGRIAHATAAVKLLLSKTDTEADELAKQVNEKNSVRKDFDSSITEEALEMIANGRKEAVSTVLFKEDWHKGVIGIVASRCIEKFYRPTIILTKSENYAAGSARSVTGFDVYEAISKCSDLLEQFGGHMYAAGLTMKVEQIPAFQKRFEEVVAASIQKEHLIPQIEIDLPLDIKQIDFKLYKILKQMAPFGPGNMQPVFVSKFVKDTGFARILKDSHLKLNVTQDERISIDAIGFGMAHFYSRIMESESFHICYSIDENNFNGRKSLQLMLKDIKFEND